ncbi:hypothetical protein DFH11DRAFT_1625648 [Phellopilus nigrolimitatus]|nr:hypothetical protein DFH11DRAFT_1625648 [Phellopilus nigrolimitatus]
MMVRVIDVDEGVEQSPIPSPGNSLPTDVMTINEDEGIEQSPTPSASDPSPKGAAYLPFELLLLIFSECGCKWDGARPSIPVGDDCNWLRSLRTRKRIALVCRSWRAVVTPSLYSVIYLHRVGQLPALVRALEESRSSYPNRIFLKFYVPNIWESVFCADMTQLVIMCPFLKTLAYEPTWDVREGPADLSILCIFDALDAYHAPSQLTCDIRLDYCLHKKWVDGTRPQPYAFFQNLRELSLDFDHEIPMSDLRRAQNLTLPSLEVLLCTVSEAVGVPNLGLIGRTWILPQLRRLGVSLYSGTHNASTHHALLNGLQSMCKSYGPTLRSLLLDCMNSYKNPERLLSVGFILALCPILQHFAYSHFYLEPLPRAPSPDLYQSLSQIEPSQPQCVHRALQQVEFLFPSSFRSYPGRSLRSHLRPLVCRTAYPALSRVVVLDPHLIEIPVTTKTDISLDYASALLEGSVLCKEGGVSLLNLEGQLLCVDDDYTDMSGGYEDDTSGSEYESDGDISSHFGLSDGPGSDSADEWNGELMVTEMAPPSPKPHIGREDALMIFEDTIISDTDTIYSDSESHLDWHSEASEMLPSFY